MRHQFGCLALLGILLLAWFHLQSTPAVPAVTAAGQAASPIVVRIDYSGRQQLEDLAAILDIWEVHPEQGYLIAMLLPGQEKKLANMGISYTISLQHTNSLNRGYQVLPKVTSGIPVQGFTCYRTVEEIANSMAQLAHDHPDLAVWKSAGASWEKSTAGGAAGYDLNVLVLSSHKYSLPKPHFFLMAAIHARELTTGETAARFAEHLVDQYDKDPDVTWLLDFNEVHILPMSNPDGRKKVESGLVDNNPFLSYWRKNTNSTDGCTYNIAFGVDLNRNSSFKWGGNGASANACDDIYRGSSSASEPETQTIQDYILSLFPDQRGASDSDAAPADATGLMITLHSYSNLVLWPWGWTGSPAPNAEALGNLGKKLAYFNQYTAEQSDTLYPTSGTTDDWAYGELGIAAYTIEMGTEFLEQCSYFQSTIYPGNLSALLYAAKAARRPFQSPRGPDTVSVEITRTRTTTFSGWGIKAALNSIRYNGSISTANVAAARYSLDYPTWITGTASLPMQAADGSFNSKSESAFSPLNLVDLPAGKHTLFVESRDAQGNWGVPTAAKLQAPLYALSISPGVTQTFGAPGLAAQYPITVQNLSSAEDTYHILIAKSGWAISAPITLPVMAPGAQISFLVSITPPLTASAGISDTAWIQIVSQADNLVTATARLTTRYVDYGFTISPTSILGEGVRDATLQYPVRIYNQGALSDTYAISLTNSTWAPAYPSIVGPIAPGDTATFEIAVHIPDGSSNPRLDQTALEIRSSGNALLSRTVLITTRMLGQYYLPWIANR